MRIHLAGRYTAKEFADIMAEVLPILTEGQIGGLEDIDISLTAFDLDGRETYPSDMQGRHAGLRVYRENAGNDEMIATGWHFPWLSGQEWPEDRR
ncbi:hypothetical protein [Sphingomonas sp. Leaf412]|uniref:hypothetical protein n=1 Tax=Sphingomonas sp. Leaf412 TaxID=1736370 RepID=UPI000AE6786C|nr:hypothetical protein [Sphingomonas sp. Leaf412]